MENDRISLDRDVPIVDAVEDALQKAFVVSLLKIISVTLKFQNCLSICSN